MIWHWLVEQGLVKDAIAAAVATVVGHLALWRPVRRHTRNQERIADLLDTKTPGGLADLAKSIERPNGSSGKG